MAVTVTVAVVNGWLVGCLAGWLAGWLWWQPDSWGCVIALLIIQLSLYLTNIHYANVCSLPIPDSHHPFSTPTTYIPIANN